MEKRKAFGSDSGHNVPVSEWAIQTAQLTFWDVQVAESIQLHDLLNHNDYTSHQILLAEIMWMKVPRKQPLLELGDTLLGPQGRHAGKVLQRKI